MDLILEIHKFYSYCTHEICGIRVFDVITLPNTHNTVTQWFEIVSGTSKLLKSEIAVITSAYLSP